MRKSVIIGIAAGIASVWLATGPVLAWLWPNLAERGQVGDSFGALNALFSGLALGGVIVAVVLQSRELELQRDELKKSVEAQKELVGQAKADSRAEQAVRVLNGYAQWQTAAQVVCRPLGSNPKEMKPAEGRRSPFAQEVNLNAAQLQTLWGHMFECIRAHNSLALIDPTFATGPAGTHPTAKLTKALTDLGWPDFDGVRYTPLAPHFEEPEPTVRVSEEVERLANAASREVMERCKEAQQRLHRLLPDLQDGSA